MNQFRLSAVFAFCGILFYNAVAGTPASTTGVDTFDESVNIFSRNTELPAKIPMQGFSIDSDGSVWYTQVSHADPHHLYVCHAQPNPGRDKVIADDYMTLTYFGHGTNTAIEEDGDDRWVWAGCYGSANNKAAYWTERLVGRVKYRTATTVNTDACDEYYYIGDYTNMHPSIDAENGLLTINYADETNGAFRCFVVYKLDEAKKAPLRDITFTCTDGFRTGNYKSTDKTQVTVKARDLTAVRPVARPKFLKSGYGKKGDRYYAWQGFDVNGDRLYYADGEASIGRKDHDWDKCSSRAFVTVFDLEGNVVEPRTEVAIIGDAAGLADAALSGCWSIESEGVKVYGDSLYLGFGSRGHNADSLREFTQCILRFKKAAN